MKKKLLTLLTILTVLTSYSQTSKEELKQKNKQLTTQITQNINSDFKTIDLEFDFKVKIGKEEEYGDLKTYSFFQLSKNNVIIYEDSSLTEYEFRNKLFPIIMQTGDNSFELLFEVNDSPTKNYLRRLIVKDNKLQSQDKLPLFEGKPFDINNDGVLEYAGF